MERIQRSILIDAPAARVFDFLTQPENLLEISPSLVEVSNVEVSADGAHAFDWTYKMAGARFHGRSRTIDVERDQRRVVRSEGGIVSTFTWGFVPREKGTELTAIVDYELPLALLGRLAAPFLRHLNEREAETLLENLKERLEASVADAGAPRERGHEPPPPHPGV
jgi:carbon monoxide dehydrogenase subunit G